MIETNGGGIGTQANQRFAVPRNPQVALALGSDVEARVVISE
jgi:hypothetical protein